MEEVCYSIAIEIDNNKNPMMVLGQIVNALSDIGYDYISIKHIEPAKHWDNCGLKKT